MTAFRRIWQKLSVTRTHAVRVACFGKYLWLWFGGDQVIGTDTQKCLLDGKEGEDSPGNPT